MSELLETCTTNALLHAARRNALSYHVPGCPRCGSGRYDMQLTAWLCVPAEWRCRKCGFHFHHEPVVSNAGVQAAPRSGVEPGTQS